MNNLPLAQNKNIVVQNFDKEILIYNLAEDRAFCLNETLSIVYQACDGTTTFDKLKNKYNFSHDVIYLALDELKKEGLLDEAVSYVSPFAGMSRREVIRKVGLASIITLPLISSLVAPTAANAASGAAPPAVACASVGATCSCTNGDSVSCGQGSAIKCPANCTCFLPAGFGTCTSANCGANCG